MKEGITLVVTSCGRFELLRRTLVSFFKFADVMVTKVIIVEDSGLPASVVIGIMQKILSGMNLPKVPFVLVHNKVNLGQLASIDLAYQLIESNLFFHLEDDWEFYRTGFIKQSSKLLELYPWIHCVWLRSKEDTNGHPMEFIRDLGFHLLRLNYITDCP